MATLSWQAGVKGVRDTHTSRLLSKSGITPCLAEVAIVHDLSGKSQKVNPAHVTWAPHPVQWANLSPMRVPVRWLKPKELLWPDQRHLKERKAKTKQIHSNNKDNHIPPCCWHCPSQSITFPFILWSLKKKRCLAWGGIICRKRSLISSSFGNDGNDQLTRTLASCTKGNEIRRENTCVNQRRAWNLSRASRGEHLASLSLTIRDARSWNLTSTQVNWQLSQKESQNKSCIWI